MIAAGISISGGNFQPIDPGFHPTPRQPLGKPGIQAPRRTTFGDVMPDVQKYIGDAPTIQAPQLGKVTTVPGFGDDYFNSILEDARKGMNKQFYGPGGVTEKAQETWAGRGMLGSSVESGGMRDIASDFGDAMGKLESDVFRMKTEKNIEEAREMRKLQQERDLKQAGFGMDAAMKNADLYSAFKELGIRSALTEAADQSKFDIGSFEQQVKLEEIAGEQEAKRRQIILDMLTSPEVDMDESQTSAIMNSLFGYGGVGGGGGGGGGWPGGGGGAYGGVNPLTGNPIGPADGSRIAGLRDKLMEERERNPGFGSQLPGYGSFRYPYGGGPGGVPMLPGQGGGATRTRDELLDALLGLG